MAKASGDDDLRREAQSKINQLTNKYNKLCNASGLPTQKERMSVSGFRSVKEKSQLKNLKTIDNTTKSGIINHKMSDHIINFYEDEAEFVYSFAEIETVMSKSSLGNDFVNYIQNNGYTINMNYDTHVSKDLCGIINGKNIEIYVANHNNATEIASTIIHEVSHERYGWKVTQEDEVNCYLMEFMFVKNDVTEEDITKIVNYVKHNYKYLPKGELYEY